MIRGFPPQQGHHGKSLSRIRTIKSKAVDSLVEGSSSKAWRVGSRRHPYPNVALGPLSRASQSQNPIGASFVSTAGTGTPEKGCRTAPGEPSTAIIKKGPRLTRRFPQSGGSMEADAQSLGLVGRKLKSGALHLQIDRPHEVLMDRAREHSPIRK